MSGTTVRRVLILVSALLGTLTLAPAAAPAGAGFVAFPSTVTVGQAGVPASIGFQNTSIAPNTSSVCNAEDPIPPCGGRGILLVPSCFQLAGGACTAAGADPGVFAIAPTAAGRLGTACGGMAFAVAVVDPGLGTVHFKPQPAGAHVTLPVGGPSCLIDFTLDVLRSPIDQDPTTPGAQTAEAIEHGEFVGPLGPGSPNASHRGTAGGPTVLRAAPSAIVTRASPGFAVGSGGMLTDTATVTGRVNPQGAATVTFVLYGPDDTACTGAPAFSSTVAYPVAGGPVTSGSLVPTQAGTYRWRAAYSGDANNLPVSGLCNDPAEVVVVAAAPPPPPQPNIVVVMTDDQNVEQMGALRRVRRLIGGRGTTFARNFSTFPLCCPSRATFLTGQYSHNHGVRGNSPPDGGFYKLDSSNTLPVWLGGAGYATAHIGKYLNGYGTRDPRQVPAGWQEWMGSVDPTTYNFRSFCLNVSGQLVRYGQAPRRACPAPVTQRRGTYQGDLYTRLAVDYIGRRAPSAQPFFLSVAYLAPHSGGPNDGGRCDGSAKPAARHRTRFAGAPLPRPPGFNERDVRDKPVSIRRLPRLDVRDIAQIRTRYRCRRASLLAVDEGVEKLVEALRAAGELETTLFVFTSDNGFFGGEHRVPGGKFKVYEPSVRVPVLIAGPGVPPNARVDQLTGNVDLAATIVKAARATPGRVLDGVSLVDVARSPQAFSGRPILLANGPSGPQGDPHYAAIRTSRYKYVEYVTGERELYDLRVDPFEQRSVHRSRRYRGVRARLATQLRSLRTCAGATCR